MRHLRDAIHTTEEARAIISGRLFRFVRTSLRLKVFHASLVLFLCLFQASAAAPLYFEEVKLGNYVLQDGGVCVHD